MYITSINSIDDDKMDKLLEFFNSEHDDDILDVGLQILQALLVVTPSSKLYTVYTQFFRKYEGANIVVINFMSKFSMFITTNSNVNSSNEDMGHD